MSYSALVICVTSGVPWKLRAVPRLRAAMRWDLGNGSDGAHLSWHVVSGQELLEMWVGEAECNVLLLFWDAETVDDALSLHVVILDKIDSLEHKQGMLCSDSSGIRDSVVNQLLAMIDGVSLHVLHPAC